MTESEFYQNEIKPLLKKRRVAFCRVELFGLPDIYVARDNKVLWIELKCLGKRSKLVKPQWRLGQLAWIKYQNLFGNDNIYLALKYVNKTYFLMPRETYLESELNCQKEVFFERLKI